MDHGNETSQPRTVTVGMPPRPNLTEAEVRGEPLNARIACVVVGVTPQGMMDGRSAWVSAKDAADLVRTADLGEAASEWKKGTCAQRRTAARSATRGSPVAFLMPLMTARSATGPRECNTTPALTAGPLTPAARRPDGEPGPGEGQAGKRGRRIAAPQGLGVSPGIPGPSMVILKWRNPANPRESDRMGQNPTVQRRACMRPRGRRR